MELLSFGLPTSSFIHSICHSHAFITLQPRSRSRFSPSGTARQLFGNIALKHHTSRIFVAINKQDAADATPSGKSSTSAMLLLISPRSAFSSATTTLSAFTTARRSSAQRPSRMNTSSRRRSVPSRPLPPRRRLTLLPPATSQG